MLFTGSIRHTEDERLSLSGDDNSVLSISSAREEDSGQYQCRIMVETPVSVTHSLTVTDTFSIQAEPSQAVVSVPLRGQTSLSCRTVGASAEIQWTRDGARFSRTESYRQTGSTVELENVTLEDAGYYYCTAEGPDGERKTASIQVKVRVRVRDPGEWRLRTTLCRYSSPPRSCPWRSTSCRAAGASRRRSAAW